MGRHMMPQTGAVTLKDSMSGSKIISLNTVRNGGQIMNVAAMMGKSNSPSRYPTNVLKK